MNRIKYQQGDVLLTKIEDDKKLGSSHNSSRIFTTEITGKVTLALGEATGHHHRFEQSKFIPGLSVRGYGNRWNNMPSTIEIKGGEATLYHEEHNPLTIPMGTYLVTKIREMDHIGGRVRAVVD